MLYIFFHLLIILKLYLNATKPISKQRPKFLIPRTEGFAASKFEHLQLGPFLGYGLHASIYEAHTLDGTFNVALKLIEHLKEEDDYRFEAMDREEKVYICLQQHVAQGGPAIAPRFWGRFASENRMEALVLELLSERVKDWNDLTKEEKYV